MIEVNRYPFRVCLILMLLLVFAKAAPAETLANSSGVAAPVDWGAFLSQHDLVWDRVPNRWEVAPYTGNGNVGFLFYQAGGEAKNVISIYAGRHDYYDHRLPHEGQEMLWIYRSRLPLGHFSLTSKGAIKSANLRLDLWNAELTGTITTEEGAYKLRGLSHSLRDVIYFETDATGGESIEITWHPDEPMPPVRATLNRGGGPKGGSWDRMRTAPMPMPPSPTWSEADGMIQMYKLGSAMRGNGPILDLMGPWYHRTFWPMVWGDLNVQLIYWTHLTANRLSVGQSLPNNLDKYADNLSRNVPERWKDSAAVAACFPQDLIAYDHGKVPDMLAWVLHNYWLHCEFAGDRDRMRDGLFPLLKRNVNGYLNFLRERPVKSDDGKIHISHSWSPEYPGGSGQDINFSLALLRWSCQTLLSINEEHGLNDPLATEWQNIVDNLVDFQIDENGLRIGKDVPFDKPHRHYSHLLAFYPLAVLTPETETNKQLLRTTLDHWLDVSINSRIKVGAMPVTGYTATGAASMYATLGDAEKAYEYLDFFIQHKNVSPTTMYAEGNPVIESPLSFATCIHDMLLQSWDGKIRVFPAAPKRWPNVAFRHLRTQGAFLVGAKKKAGVTQFVTVESLTGSPCFVRQTRIYVGPTPLGLEWK